MKLVLPTIMLFIVLLSMVSLSMYVLSRPIVAITKVLK